LHKYVQTNPARCGGIFIWTRRGLITLHRASSEVLCGPDYARFVKEFFISLEAVTASSSAFADGCGGRDEASYSSSLFRIDVYCSFCVRKDLCLETAMKLLAVLMLCAVSLFAAVPQFFIQGSTSWERNRLIRMEQSLNFTKEPMTSTWEVIILPGEQFRDNVTKWKLDTDSAYTILQLRQTYVNEDYLVYADDVRVRQTTAHEAGHLICECSSEEKANEIAYQLQFK
jgi:hypothetical protein